MLVKKTVITLETKATKTEYCKTTLLSDIVYEILIEE